MGDKKAIVDANMIIEQVADEAAPLIEEVRRCNVIVQHARAQKLCGVVMALLKGNEDSKNIRIREEVQDARSNHLKEDQVLPKCVREKMIRTLGGR
jgi:hypothetical protein